MRLQRLMFLEAPDMARVVRLVNDLYDLPPDSVARHSLLLRKLCEMCGASVAVSEILLPPDASRRKASSSNELASDKVTRLALVVYVDETAKDAKRSARKSAAARGKRLSALSPHVAQSLQSDQLGDAIHSRVVMRSPRQRSTRQRQRLSCLSLYRSAKSDKQFAERDRRILETLHSETHWMFDTEQAQE